MSDFEDRLRRELHDLGDSVEPPPTLANAMGSGPRRHRRQIPPRVPIAITALIVLVAAALGVTAVRARHPRRLVVSGSPTATAVIPDTTLGTSTALTVPPPMTGPPSTVPAGGVTTATTAAAPATTVRSTTTTTTVPPCQPADLRTTTATDKPSYPNGATVTITVTVQNTSARRCQIQQPYPQTFGSTVKVVMVSNTGPTLVWAPAPYANGVLVMPAPKVLDPGASYTWTTAQWDQRSCTNGCDGSRVPEGGQEPPGTYQAEPNDGLNPPSPASPATFTLTGAVR